MTIREALAGQVVNSVLQGIYVDPIYTQFVSAVRNGLGLKYNDFSSIIKAESVVKICANAGINTVEELNAKIASNTVNYATLSAREPIVITHTATHDDLRNIIQQSVGYSTIPTVRWFQNDDTYGKLTQAGLDEILLYVANKSPLYRATVYDCDDYQKEFLGWLASSGLGNVSIGACNVYVFDIANNLVGTHAMCVVVYDNTAKLLEPQTGKLHEFNDRTVGSFLLGKTIKVSEVVF